MGEGGCACLPYRLVIRPALQTCKKAVEGTTWMQRLRLVPFLLFTVEILRPGLRHIRTFLLYSDASSNTQKSASQEPRCATYATSNTICDVLPLKWPPRGSLLWGGAEWSPRGATWCPRSTFIKVPSPGGPRDPPDLPHPIPGHFMT